MRAVRSFIGIITIGTLTGLGGTSLAMEPGAGSTPVYLDDISVSASVGVDLIAEQPDPGAVSYFQAQLTPYGSWVSTSDYGQVFQPSNLPADWRPYTAGHWVYTDDSGWLWVSDEPFGWATYHYGRWTLDSRLGWVWVPGATWAPAWVVWRHGDGVDGWAPLPPVRGGTDVNVAIDRLNPEFFSFVDERDFADANIRAHIRPVKENVTIINKTTNITKYENVQGHVVNRSVDVNEVEKASGKKVEHVKIADSKDAKSAHVGNGEVAVYRPQVTEGKGEAQKAAEKPTVERQAADKQAAEKQAAEKQAAEKQAVDKQAANKELEEKQAAEKRATDQLPDQQTAAREAADRQNADKQAADKQAADKQTAEKQAAEKQTVEKQPADKSAGDKVAEHEPAGRDAAQDKSAEQQRNAQEATDRQAAEHTTQEQKAGVAANEQKAVPQDQKPAVQEQKVEPQAAQHPEAAHETSEHKAADESHAAPQAAEHPTAEKATQGKIEDKPSGNDGKQDKDKNGP